MLLLTEQSRPSNTLHPTPLNIPSTQLLNSPSSPTALTLSPSPSLSGPPPPSPLRQLKQNPSPPLPVPNLRPHTLHPLTLQTLSRIRRLILNALPPIRERRYVVFVPVAYYPR